MGFWGVFYACSSHYHHATMFATFFLILPDFLLMALGLVLVRFRFLLPDFFHGAEKLVYYVLFPALLFSSMAKSELSLQQISTLGLGTALVILAGVAMTYVARPLLHPDALQHASVAQCGYRFNSYLAFSIAGALGGTAGLSAMAVIAVVAVPLGNIAAVSGLAQRGKSGSILLLLLKNPLIIGTLSGLAWNLLGLPLPQALEVTLSRLGSSALALGLICVGASFSVHALQGAQRLVSWMIAVKLLFCPVVALVLNAVMPLNALEQQMLLLFATLPTASTTYVLAVRMGGDGRLVALTMSLCTLFAAVSMPLWLMIRYA